MTDLEKKIALIILEGRGRGTLNTQLASDILNLPSGLESVKPCGADSDFHTGLDMTPACVYCGGSGELTKNMTVGEVLEYARGMVEATHEILRTIPEANVEWAITLPGDRLVRVKEMK